MRRSLLVSLCLVLLLANPRVFAQQNGGKPDDGDNGPDGLKALKHPDVQVRFNAVELLGKLGKTAKFAAPKLRELLKDPSVAVRIKTAEALWKIEQPDPKPLLAVLLEATNDKEDIVRATAFNILAQFGDKAKPAVPAVKKGLKDTAFNVKLQAVLAAGALGPVAKETVPELIEIMRDDDTGFLEAQTTMALRKIGVAAVSPLRKGLTDTSAKVRRASAFALGLLGPKAYEAVPDLTKSLKDDEPLVRSFAAEALGKIGSEAEAAMPELAKALKDEDTTVQISAALACWRINQNKVGMKVLVTALAKGADAPIRRSAAAALGEFGAAAKTAVPGLSAGLKDQDEEVQQECLSALGKIGPAAAAAVEKIRPLLKDKSFPIRLQAVQALWKIEKTADAKSLAVLEQALKREETEEVLLAVQILGDIGPTAKKIVPALLELAHHRDKEIRGAAVMALKKIKLPAAVDKGAK